MMLKRLLQCLGVVFLAGFAHAEIHEFSLPDGKSVRAEIIDYNARMGLVELRREDGKLVKVKPSVFIESDQSYIRDWTAAHLFLSEQTLKVDCDDRVVKEWKEEETQDVKYTDGSVEENFVHNIVKYEEIAYEFTLMNDSPVPMEGLVLEYCIYYEQSTMAWESKPEVQQKTFHGQMEIPALTEGQKYLVTTKPVMVYEDDINPIPQLNGDQRRLGEGEIIGIHARLTSKADASACRKISSPSSFSEEKYPFTTESSPNRREAYRRNRG